MDVIPYPRMLYKTEDEYMIVDGEEQEGTARAEGFVDYSELSQSPDPSPPKRIEDMNRDELAAFVKDTWGETIPRNVRLDDLKAQVVARLEA